jgi:hypothetical protein
MEGKSSGGETKFEGEGKTGGGAAADASWLDDDADPFAAMCNESSVLANTADWFSKHHGTFFADFCRRHLGAFDGAPDDPGADGECRLEWSALHERYLTEFTTLIEDFISSEGADLAAFVKDCDSIRNGRSVSVIQSKAYDDFAKSLMWVLV